MNFESEVFNSAVALKLDHYSLATSPRVVKDLGLRQDFGIRDVAACCHEISVKTGWWQSGDFNLIELINNPIGTFEKMIAGALVAQKICLSHSELSEAMEGHRKNLMDDKLPHRKMIEVELADTVARIFDLAGALKLDVAGALIEKLHFNTTRLDHKPENRLKENGKGY